MDLPFGYHDTPSDNESQEVSCSSDHSSSPGSPTVLRHQISPTVPPPSVSFTSQSFHTHYHAPGFSDHVPSRIDVLPPAASFSSYTPATLPSLLSDPNTLILDLRPSELHLKSRLPEALSISVVSSTLSSPHFSIAEIAAMTFTPADRDKLSRWRSAHNILVYDIDSSDLQEGNNILGLLRKFRATDALSLTYHSQSPHPRPRIVKHELAWLKGGFEAVWRERRDLVDIDPLPMTDRRAVNYSEPPDPLNSDIESWRKRPRHSRDELQDAVNLLRDVLPPSENQNVSLIHHATAHIKSLETTTKPLKMRLQRVESDIEQLKAEHEILEPHRMTVPFLQAASIVGMTERAMVPSMPRQNSGSLVIDAEFLREVPTASPNGRAHYGSYGEVIEEYSRLQAALPYSNRTEDPVDVLIRAVEYVKDLELSSPHLQAKIKKVEGELDQWLSFNKMLRFVATNQDAIRDMCSFLLYWPQIKKKSSNGTVNWPSSESAFLQGHDADVLRSSLSDGGVVVSVFHPTRAAKWIASNYDHFLVACGRSKGLVPMPFMLSPYTEGFAVFASSTNRLAAKLVQCLANESGFPVMIRSDISIDHLTSDLFSTSPSSGHSNNDIGYDAGHDGNDRPDGSKGQWKVKEKGKGKGEGKGGGKGKGKGKSGDDRFGGDWNYEGGGGGPSGSNS